MPRKKAPVEEEPKKEETPFESEGWGESSGGPVPKEAVGHMMRAATEFLGAMDSMMLAPKRMMPDEVKVHYVAAKKEMMLMARAMLDAKIAACDASHVKEEEPRVRKINLE